MKKQLTPKQIADRLTAIQRECVLHGIWYLWPSHRYAGSISRILDSEEFPAVYPLFVNRNYEWCLTPLGKQVQAELRKRAEVPR